MLVTPSGLNRKELKMSQAIVTQLAEWVNFTLTDGVYDYPDPVDKFVVIIEGEEVAWASTKPQAERSFNELLHYDGEHYRRCPSDYRPNPLANACSAVKVPPFRLQQATPAPVSRDSSGAHISLLGAGYRRVEE